MALTINRNWADVYVGDATHKPALEAKALFFLAIAPQRCVDAHVSAASLALAYSNLRTEHGPEGLAGKSIHTKVLGGKPVSYESAVGFINVSRGLLTKGGQPPLETSDIVACVFRLKDPDILAAALGTSLEEIADHCHMRRRVVDAALTRYRLPLVFALSIWGFFRDLQALGRGASNPLVATRLTEDPRDFIKTDNRAPFAIKPFDDDEYVYSIADLRPAPRVGHPWALERDEAEAAA